MHVDKAAQQAQKKFLKKIIVFLTIKKIHLFLVHHS
jgi:hypothetical protein